MIRRGGNRFPEKHIPDVIGDHAARGERERDRFSWKRSPPWTNHMGLPNKKVSSDEQALASALRTLEAERDGIAVLMEALADELGASFAAAVDLIARRRGRVIVTGMGKSGH